MNKLPLFSTCLTIVTLTLTSCTQTQASSPSSVDGTTNQSQIPETASEDNTSVALFSGGNVSLMSRPASGSGVVGKIKVGEQVIVSGPIRDESNRQELGWYKIEDVYIDEQNIDLDNCTSSEDQELVCTVIPQP